MSFKNKNQKVFGKIYQKVRIKLYKLLNTFNGAISGTPILMQPLQLVGKGKINFQKEVQIGYYPAPRYYDGLSYLEVRNEEASINFGNNIAINNNLIIICANTSVSIGDTVFIDHDVEIIDSDTHTSVPVLRKENAPNASLPIIIVENVFIRNCVKFLKGVQIRKNNIIAHCSVFTKSFPKNVIVSGNPTKIIRNQLVE